MRDELFRYSFAPSSTGATDPSKELSRLDARSFCPFVKQTVDPLRDGNGSNVTGLSPQVDDCPMPFTLLKVCESQRGEFMAAESTCQQECKQGPITFSFQALAIWCLPDPSQSSFPCHRD